MKKTKALLLTILSCLIACCLFLFAGCKKTEGTYKFNQMSYTEQGMSVDLKVGEKFMNMITLTEDYITITLNEDGTVSMTTAGELPVTGSWAENGKDKINLTFNSETITCDCDGKTLIMASEGVIITLRKAK